MTTRIGIVCCERTQDASCVGCSKCCRAINGTSFAFEQIEGDLEVVFKTGCGDCPGLVLPRIDLQKIVLDSLDTGFDAIYFRTCVKTATALMNCPMNIDGIAAKIEEKLQVPVHVGTHDY